MKQMSRKQQCPSACVCWSVIWTRATYKICFLNAHSGGLLWKSQKQFWLADWSCALSSHGRLPLTFCSYLMLSPNTVCTSALISTTLSIHHPNRPKLYRRWILHDQDLGWPWPCILFLSLPVEQERQTSRTALSPLSEESNHWDITGQCILLGHSPSLCFLGSKCYSWKRSCWNHAWGSLFSKGATLPGWNPGHASISLNPCF